MVETKEVPKVANPYVRPMPRKCFKCNQPCHTFSDCPLRKAVHLAERREEDDNEVCYESDGNGEDEGDSEDDDEGQNYVVRKLILTPKQEENTQRQQLF